MKLFVYGNKAQCPFQLFVLTFKDGDAHVVGLALQIDLTAQSFFCGVSCGGNLFYDEFQNVIVGEPRLVSFCFLEYTLIPN